jgi:hypothetical protein
MFTDVVKKPLFEVFKRQKKVADVGIEIEIEGAGLPESVSHWSAKSEGSLQQGLEYITKPIKAENVKQYVDHLKAVLGGYTVKNTYRCSTHIHVNMLPEAVEDILGYYVVFSMFEPLLLSLCGNQRDGNLFCMSSYDTGDLTDSFDQMCRAFEMIDQYGFGYERGKYSSLNSGRLADLGTLEARCFPMSLDGTQVADWVGWLLRMRDMVRAEPDKTFRSLWKNVRQNPTWYANIIFGQAIYTIPNHVSLVDFGTECAYELTKVLKKYRNKTAEEAPQKKDRPKKGLGSINTLSAAAINDLYASMAAPTVSGSGGGSFFTSSSGSWATAVPVSAPAAWPSDLPQPIDDVESQF